MNPVLTRHFNLRVVLATLLTLATLASFGTAFADTAPQDALLSAGEKNQVIRFNPDAALQKRVFADSFVPNSSELSLQLSGTAYTAQRAENLATGQVRVYYVVTGDWANVKFVERGKDDNDALGGALLLEGEKKLVIRFNPGAALQKRIFANSFVPNSGEFATDVSGTSYTAQRAESLKTGEVRVYYVVTGDWGNVQTAVRGGSPPPAAPPAATAAPAPTQASGFAKVGQDIEAKGWRFKVTEVHKRKAVYLYDSSYVAFGHFLILFIQATNLQSGSDYFYGNIRPWITNDAATIYRYSAKGSSYAEWQFTAGSAFEDVNPGKNIIMALAFDVPDNEGHIMLSTAALQWVDLGNFSTMKSED